MSTIYVVLYYGVLTVFSLYVLAQLAALSGALLASVNVKLWLVDPKNPQSKSSMKGAIRDMEAMEIVVVGRGGSPAFPVITQSARRISTHGLQTEEPMDRTNHTHWDVRKVEESEKFRSTIQSVFGYLSPIYTFRSLVHRFTGKQVVRIWFPFYIMGFYALYEPITMKFMRARAKGLNKNGDFQKVLDTTDSVSKYEIVEDVTDHMLWQFPLRTITESLPTKNGFSIRTDVTVLLEVSNALDLVSFKDWSSLIASKVSNAVSRVVRAGTLENVYATTDSIEKSLDRDDVANKEVTGGNRIQKAIHISLSEEKYIDGKTLMGMLGLTCLQVVLNDLIPADEATEKRIVEIMSIQIEGEKRAIASGRNIEERIRALKDATPEQVNSLAAITAAQEAGKGGKIDWIIGANQGNVSFGDVMSRRVSESVRKSTEKGDKK